MRKKRYHFENVNIEIPAQVDETIETLEKGSPRLNWIYVLMALIIIFLSIWLVTIYFPGNNQESLPSSQTIQNQDINQRISDLESRIDALEAANGLE
ncbi:hypothetical protein AWM75_05890 [Aerococcus urinaehominis]|uniref:Uncharacterized protein n=1 Tax=Aerococcus urinaehominis TaxID=128944 RepID=A0A0X8FLL1_9LACT|nr:hypothetical protein [Aerococcus urinaehominis]AMB99555.1 hypothetical protein AWM75_05890 [Aerococcus urinaehominis]SDM34983.1 hypothetical protein SAMN04487985_11338 [Aerococcus urinaehominis]